MLGKLLAVFILVPLIEFTLLVQVAAETGFLMTFFLVVATGALGSHLARRRAFSRLFRSLKVWWLKPSSY